MQERGEGSAKRIFNSSKKSVDHIVKKEAAEVLQPLWHWENQSSALAMASWKSLVSVKISCL